MHVINLGVYCLHIKVELFSYHNCSICIFCIAIYVLYFECTHNTVHFATFILSHNVQYMLKHLCSQLACNLNVVYATMCTCGLVLCS